MNAAYSINTVLVLTLSDGTEMIGRLKAYNSVPGTYQIEKPLKSIIVQVPQMTANGPSVGISMQLVPAFPHSGKLTFDVRDAALLVDPCEAPKGVSDAWLQMTSGIQLA